MRTPRIVFAYRYGLLGGVSMVLLNRLPSFAQHFDVRVLYEKDYGATRLFPPGVARVTGTEEERVRAIRDLDPDFFVVIDSPSFLHSWRTAGRPGALIIEVHTTTSNLSYLDDVAVLDGVSAFVTVSEYMLRRLQRQGLERVAPVFVVPNCLQISQFDVPPPPVDVRPLLWVGKLDQHKRWRAALDVIEDVLEQLRQPDIRPVIIGGYTAGAAVISEFLRRITLSPVLRDAIWWPYLERDRIPGLLAAAAATGGGMLVTSRDESFGLSVAEGVLAGCPVIAPAVGALPELLPPEAMYEPDDGRDARALVTRMLTDDGYREKIRSARRSEVRQLVDPERCVRAFLDVLASLGHRTKK